MKEIKNTFAVSGFVGQDAEIRQFLTSSVARFSIAVARTETVDGKSTRVSAFMPVEAWRKNESLESFDILKKGELITVEGYFKPEQWSSADGTNRNRVVMTATKFYVTPDKFEKQEKTTEKGK
jgi:single-strand DNA-binding protein